MRKLTLNDCFKYPNAKIIKQYQKGEYSESIFGFILHYCPFEEFDKENMIKNHIGDYKLKLRPIRDLTEQEINYLLSICNQDDTIFNFVGIRDDSNYTYYPSIDQFHTLAIDYLRSINIDIDGFIQLGIAIY